MIMEDYKENHFEQFYIKEQSSKFGLEEFELYQSARNFRKKIYNVIKSLPKEENYSLNPQMRKAIISVSNNIAEGHGRYHFQERTQFCRIARGSTEEIIDDLNICIDEKYYPVSKCKSLKIEGYNLIKQINGYITFLEKSKKNTNVKR